MSQLLNAIDAAVKLGYKSRNGLYRSVKRNGIPHLWIGDTIRFDAADLDKYIAMRKAKAKCCTTCGRPVASTRSVH